MAASAQRRVLRFTMMRIGPKTAALGVVLTEQRVCILEATPDGLGGRVALKGSEDH